jgi:hypothetical protein
MKKLMTLFLLLPFFLNGQSSDYAPGGLYAQVNGDTVFLSQSMAIRNCGAAYDMKVILLDDTLYWYQVDTGATAVCLCNFNLSVTVDSMPAGHYTAKVYYTECPDCPPPGADTGYVGSIEFVITAPNSNTSIHTIDQGQSDCFPYNALDDGKARPLPYLIFPNPVGNSLHISTTDLDEKVVSIIDLQGRSLFEYKSGDKELDIDISSYKSGMYILLYSGNAAIYHSKFIKEY